MNKLFSVLLYGAMIVGFCACENNGPDSSTGKRFIVAVVSGDVTMGSVTGSGEYEENEAVKIEAIAFDGHCFVEWNDGNTDNPRAIIVTQDTAFIAMFRHADIHENHEYVDLGLPSGTLWATCNVGATKPEEYGDYFAWGETKPKEKYSWDNEGEYKWGVENDIAPNYGMTKYNVTDGKTVLEAADDAATANWGGAWRMPTVAEQEELRTECTWTLTDNYNNTGVAGQIVASKAEGNTNFIFLPLAGFYGDTTLKAVELECRYWTSSLCEYNPEIAYVISRGFFGTSGRCLGIPVRPVCSPR